MNEDRKAPKESHRIDFYKDEKELMDYLLVLWKWKYLILSGTVICAIIALIISLTTPKNPEVYRIDMVLEPGVKKINDEGEKVYIKSPNKIKGLVEGGAFNNQILNDIKDSNIKNMPVSLNFKVTIPKNTNILKISYETSNINEGKKILDSLIQALIARENEVIKLYQDHYEKKISKIERKINYLKDKEQITKSSLSKINNSLNKLSSEIQYANNNIKHFLDKKDTVLSQYNLQLLNKKDTYLRMLPTSITLKYSLILTQNEINELKIELEDIKQEIKDNIKSTRIIQPLVTTSLPKINKTRLNVILGAVGGFISMLFLAFLGERFSRYKNDHKLSKGNSSKLLTK